MVKSLRRHGPLEEGDAVEIVSPNEDAEKDWSDKLARYFECGVSERTLRSRRARGRTAARVDRIDDDLVERVVTFDRTTCVTLNLGWVNLPEPLTTPKPPVVTPVAEEPIGLRLERANGELVETAHEAAEARVREQDHFPMVAAPLACQTRSPAVVRTQSSSPSAKHPLASVDSPEKGYVHFV